jgi:malate dehydrogenase (oxaloacetate-decarboxylating)
VTLAALITACRVTGAVIKDSKVVINGAGAAGIATARLLLAQGVKEIILLDSQGTIYENRPGLNDFKKEIARKTNQRKIKGGLEQALKGADVFIGLSKGSLLNKDMVTGMNENPFIFAMANPIPEIMPDLAYEVGASIVGTGRSDFPNQINNALVFPGIFKGLLSCGAKQVTTKMKLATALAIAYSIKPSKRKILPKITEKKVVKAVANAVCNNK